MSIIIEVKSDKLPWLSKEARARAVLAVAKAADDIEGQAKAVVPVDTGNLKGSIQEHKMPDSSDLTKYVGPATEYNLYVEYGTSRMRAQPYMRPAAEAVRPAFIAALRQIAEM
jgi:HK97 gp10 family phage protein